MNNQGLGQVFGRNLRLLCEQRASPSAAARDLDINHVQMHRYLRGEAFPKPAVLKRICDYFGTDARIMTDPLPFGCAPDPHAIADLKSAEAQMPLLRAIAYAAHVQDFMPAETILKDGAYIGWSNSLAHPGKATHNIYLVKTVNGMRVTKTFDTLDLFPSIKLRRKDVAARSPYLREARGAVLTSREGVSVFMFRMPPGQWASMSFLATEPSSNESVLSGVELFGRKEYAGVQRIARTVWVPIPPGFAALLRACRIPPWLEMDQVPDFVARILRQPIG